MEERIGLAAAAAVAAAEEAAAGTRAVGTRAAAEMFAAAVAPSLDETKAERQKSQIASVEQPLCEVTVSWSPAVTIERTSPARGGRWQRARQGPIALSLRVLKDRWQPARDQLESSRGVSEHT